LGVSQNIFDNSTAFDTGKNMLHPDPDFGNSLIAETIRDAQYLAFGFLFGLKGQNVLWLIALKPGVFEERGMVWILKRFLFSDFLIVRFSAIRLAQIINACSLDICQNHVFVRVGLFFPLYASRCFSEFFGRCRRRSVPSMIHSGGAAGGSSGVAQVFGSRSGSCFKLANVRSSIGSKR
jgi:hypothetical protein